MTHWPKDEYGHFYNGDSYIILNTYKKPDSDVSLSVLFITNHYDPIRLKKEFVSLRISNINC